MNSQTGWIYMLRNLISGLEYIGQTTNLDRRMNDYKYATSCNKYLRNSIKKYGWENFEVIILHNNVKLKDLNWLERHCIWVYSTFTSDGYNLRDGGSKGLLSEETKQKISDTSKGKKHSQETIQKMKESGKGKGKGRKLSLETRNKISQSLRETDTTGINHPNCEGKINGVSFRKWRKENNISQRYLAEKIGCDQAVISNWEREIHGVSPKVRIKFRENIGFDILEKFGVDK